MRGRKKTPTALKILHGNPGKRDLPANEPRPDVAAPDAPPCLDKPAREMWAAVVTEMTVMKTLAKADLGVLAAYCGAWSTWVLASVAMKKTGKVIKTPNGYRQSPWLRAQVDASNLLIKLAAELGLSPASRARVQTVVAPSAQRAGSLKMFNEGRT